MKLKSSTGLKKPVTKQMKKSSPKDNSKRIAEISTLIEEKRSAISTLNEEIETLLKERVELQIYPHKLGDTVVAEYLLVVGQRHLILLCGHTVDVASVVSAIGVILEEIEQLSLGEVLLAILLHDFVDAACLLLVLSRCDVWLVISVSEYLVAVRNAACEAYGVECVDTCLSVVGTLGYDVVHLRKTYERYGIGALIAVCAEQRSLIILLAEGVGMTVVPRECHDVLPPSAVTSYLPRNSASIEDLNRETT